QMLAFDPLGLPFTREVSRRFQLPRIRAPVVSVKPLNPKRMQEGHVDHLVTNLKYAAAILVLQKKDPPRASAILTLIALGPVGLLACLDHLRALTVGALYRDRDHLFPPRPVVS